uniref:Uncharacterized protein n=1 Tax=Acrobeloides nanus TaxID=290746 RepID=A0A914EC82_9BILA
MMRSRPGTKRTAEAIGSSLPPKTYSEPSPVKEILIPGQPDEIPIKNELIAIPVQNIPIVQPTSAFDIKDEEEIDVT